jgi:hypothetical protein
MMLYTIVPTELVMLRPEQLAADCKNEQPQAILSTNPRDFSAATRIEIRK